MLHVVSHMPKKLEWLSALDGHPENHIRKVSVQKNPDNSEYFSFADLEFPPPLALELTFSSLW